MTHVALQRHLHGVKHELRLSQVVPFKRALKDESFPGSNDLLAQILPEKNESNVYIFFCIPYILYFFSGSFHDGMSIHTSIVSFLDASSHLYKRLCPPVRPSVGSSVGNAFVKTHSFRH